jgi:large subunit ribosomal protein L1
MRGRPVPRGQIALPRDPRSNTDTVVYFAEEGRVQDALDAGATFAGGLDLITKVCSIPKSTIMTSHFY